MNLPGFWKMLMSNIPLELQQTESDASVYCINKIVLQCLSGEGKDRIALGPSLQAAFIPLPWYRDHRLPCPTASWHSKLHLLPLRHTMELSLNNHTTLN